MALRCRRFCVVGSTWFIPFTGVSGMKYKQAYITSASKKVRVLIFRCMKAHRAGGLCHFDPARPAGKIRDQQSICRNLCCLLCQQGDSV
ncbi:hypothetical protein AERO8C_160186 [Aeromonas veronii]|uniref:Uncharacterized protein n=1 Tax=Aeromonas veronii TaxID=654 RepID=A0A653KYX0_AERVE|nr:hypothetical protein AERO8C_160186 [Aeromonas veronii]